MSSVNYLLHKDSGEIVMAGVTDPKIAKLYEVPGLHLVLGKVADVHRDFYNPSTGMVLPKPDRPSKFHEWDWVSKSWVDNRTIEDHRAAKLRELKLERDRQIESGFSWDGSVFDSDATAQMRLMGLRMKAQVDPAFSEVWRLQDNSWRILTASDVLAVWETLENHIRMAFQKFLSKEAEVNAATTVQGIQDVFWQ